MSVNISITSVWHLYFAQHLRKTTINASVFDAVRFLNLSAGVLCVGPQPAACEDRGPAVIETCYRSMAEHKDRSIQTVRGYTSVCRSDRALVCDPYSTSEENFKVETLHEKHAPSASLKDRQKLTEETAGGIVSGCCGEKCASERTVKKMPFFKGLRLPVFIQNILNCVPKTNKAFTGLERHGGKWLMTKFSFWGGVTL